MFAFDFSFTVPYISGLLSGVIFLYLKDILYYKKKLKLLLWNSEYFKLCQPFKVAAANYLFFTTP